MSRWRAPSCAGEWRQLAAAAAHDTEPPTPEPEPESPAQGTGDVAHRCDLCGAPMQEWHCRIICTFCGYQRDCSDP